MSKCFLVLICCILLLSTEVYADISDNSYLRTSIGTGLHYAGTIGLNNEYILNEYFSGQLGVGYKDHINIGVIGGVTGYPLKNNQYYISPRLTALYGRVNRVHYSDGSYKSGYGYALGGGIEYPMNFCQKCRAGFDLFYTKITDPAEATGGPDVLLSFGVGYSFN